MDSSFNIKVPGEKPYEMKQMYFSISDEDLPPEFRGCNMNERLLVSQFLLLRQGLIFREAVGDISLEKMVKEFNKLNESTLGKTFKQIKDGIGLDRDK